MTDGGNTEQGAITVRCMMPNNTSSLEEHTPGVLQERGHTGGYGTDLLTLCFNCVNFTTIHKKSCYMHSLHSVLQLRRKTRGFGAVPNGSWPKTHILSLHVYGSSWGYTYSFFIVAFREAYIDGTES